MINPIANPGQFAAEEAVAALWRMEPIKAARKTAARLFDIGYGCSTPEAARPSFDEAMDEYVTNYLFKAAASDASHPRFVRNFMPAYDWEGRAVPGARMAGDNPDNCYRLAGVEHGGRYRVTGRPIGRAPANVSFTLTGNWGTSVTIGLIENHQLQTAPDGSFTLTLDEDAPGARANHITTAPHAKFLFVRDSMADWSSETPYALEIERLDGPRRAPLTLDEMAERAAFRLVEDVPLNCWFQRMFSGLPLNTLRAPIPSSSFGGLITQALAQAWFEVRSGEAVIVRYRAADAAYAALELGDWWFRSHAPDSLQSSLTMAQCVAGADGWVEAVIAPEDPGLANWLDCSGLSHVFMYMRWQGLPAAPADGGPAIETRIVKADALATTAAGGRIDPAERRRRLERRRADWARRVTVGSGLS
jgi:hypothetical protein